MNKVLVTGSKGMLGSSIVEHYKKQNNISIIEHNRILCDLTNKLNTEQFINESKPNTIIHCSAKVGGVYANMMNNDLFFKENVMMNNNVLESAMNNNVDNFVSILSTCIFPDENITYPLTFDQLDIGKPHSSNKGYSYAKRLLYYQTKMYRNFLNKNWISIIPTNLYGINDNFNYDNSHLIPSLIRKAYEASLSNDKFIVWGDGTPLRQFLFIDDLSEIIIYALDEWKKSDTMMAINEKEYSIKEVVNIIADRFGVTNKIEWDKNKPNGQYKKTAKSDIKDFKFKSLEEGLNVTCDWFIKNYENIRK